MKRTVTISTISIAIIGLAITNTEAPLHAEDDIDSEMYFFSSSVVEHKDDDTHRDTFDADIPVDGERKIEMDTIFKDTSNAHATDKPLLEPADIVDEIDELIHKDKDTPLTEVMDEIEEEPPEADIEPSDEVTTDDSIEESNDEESADDVQPEATDITESIKKEIERIELKPGKRETDDHLKRLDNSVNRVMTTRIDKEKEIPKVTGLAQITPPASKFNDFSTFGITASHKFSKQILIETITAKYAKTSIASTQ